MNLNLNTNTEIKLNPVTPLPGFGPVSAIPFPGYNHPDPPLQNISIGVFFLNKVPIVEINGKADFYADEYGDRYEISYEFSKPEIDIIFNPYVQLLYFIEDLKYTLYVSGFRDQTYGSALSSVGTKYAYIGTYPYVGSEDKLKMAFSTTDGKIGTYYQPYYWEWSGNFSDSWINDLVKKLCVIQVSFKLVPKGVVGDTNEYYHSKYFSVQGRGKVSHIHDPGW